MTKEDAMKEAVVRILKGGYALTDFIIDDVHDYIDFFNDGEYVCTIDKNGGRWQVCARNHGECLERKEIWQYNAYGGSPKSLLAAVGFVIRCKQRGQMPKPKRIFKYWKD